jgi:MATE family multidrug resistance protein
MSARSQVTALLRLAGPVALARLGIIAMAIEDVVAVGQFAPEELPDQALGWAPTATLLVAAIGLLQGVQVLVARMLGEGRPQDAGAVWRRGVVLGVLTSLVAVVVMVLLGKHIFLAMGIEPVLAAKAAVVMQVLAPSVPLHVIYVASAYFLEAIKRPTISTMAMWCANVVNLVLVILLVPKYGAVGAAWATVGARGFLAASTVAWIWLREGERYGLRAKSSTAPGYRALLAIGVAAAVSQGVEAGAFSGMTIIAGRISASTVAAYQILLNMVAFVFMIALGVSAATAVLVSEAVGRKAPQEATRAGWTGLGLNTLAMSACGGILLLSAPVIGGLYTADLTLAAYVGSLIWMAALIIVPDGGQVVAATALRARDDNWFPTLSHIVAYAVVMPFLGWWLAEHRQMGTAGLLLAVFWASVLSFGVLMLRWIVVTQRQSRSAAEPAANQVLGAIPSTTGPEA